MSRQARLFISHRHAYQNDYWSLKRRIQGWGMSVRDSSWHDHKIGDEFIPDAEIREKLGRAIAWCNIFIVVARPATSNSQWCNWEVTYADGMGKPILAYSPHGMSRLPRFITETDNYAGTFTNVNRLENLVSDLLL